MGTAGDAPDAWEGERVDRWIRTSDALERQLAPVADLIFDAAHLAPGEGVLDVGCGTGPTTRRAAELVGADARVVGLDVAPQMLDAAAAVATAPSAALISWVAADAATWDGDGKPFDVVLSRFGVMFFDDPLGAFTNLASLTRPGGRLCAAVWPDRTRVPLFDLPLQVAVEHRRRRGWGEVETPPSDGGPFSLGDPQIVAQLLEASGWSDVRSEPHGLRLSLGGGLAPAGAASQSLEQGPTRLATSELADEQREDVATAIATALEAHVEGGVVVLDAEVIVVSARRATV